MSSVGPSIGSVMCSVCRDDDAPSTRAASYRRSGMALQAGKEDDHVVAEILPHREQDDRGHREVGVPKPIHRIHAEVAQRIIHHAVAGMEQIAPDHRDRHEGGDDRGEQCSPEERPETRQAGMQQQRRAQGQRQ